MHTTRTWQTVSYIVAAQPLFRTGCSNHLPAVQISQKEAYDAGLFSVQTFAQFHKYVNLLKLKPRNPCKQKNNTGQLMLVISGSKCFKLRPVPLINSSTDFSHVEKNTKQHSRKKQNISMSKVVSTGKQDGSGIHRG